MAGAALIPGRQSSSHKDDVRGLVVREAARAKRWLASLPF